MRKEVIFAIIAGALFGLVIAFGIWKINRQAKPEGIVDVQEPNTPPEVVDGQEQIVFSKPYNFQVIDTSQTTVTGVTKPNSLIVVSSEGDDQFITVNNNGEFEVNVKLVAGVNEIIFDLYSPKENPNVSANQKLLLVYSTELSNTPDNNEN